MSESDVQTCSLPGRHLLADMTGIRPELLRDGRGLMRKLELALRKSGFHIVNSVEHQFREKGHGFTGVFLLAESHAAIHSYPEREYLALDIFGCGDADPFEALNALKDELGPQDVYTQVVDRTVSCLVHSD